MIIKKDKQINFDSNTQLEGFDATISEEDMHKLWDMLQDPYKNPIGAVVREYVSNCFDSHAEANVNDAVLVKIAKDDTGWYWACEDYGVGLSPERMKDVFCSYLKSTKENTNDMIGAFGLGSKSGLSYVDIVHIRTRFEGTEYLYMLRKGEKTPRLDKITEYPTTERNGTQIKIYIKNSKRNNWSSPEPEIWRFKEECRKQLCYFDNVYFDGCDIDNDYKIYEGTHWKYSTTDKPFKGLHMCIGSVAYPIDWDNLPIDKISLNIALKFDIGELDIIQTREDVKYTPRTKQAILDKIDSLKKELKDRWHKQEFELTDFGKWFYEYHGSKVYVLPIDIENDITIDLDYIFNSAELEKFDYFYFKELKDVDSRFRFPTYPFFEYKIERRVTEDGKLRKKVIYNSSMFGCINHDIVYRIKGKPAPTKNRYIAEEVEESEFYLLRKDTEVEEKDYDNHLHLDEIPKHKREEHKKLFQKIILDFLKLKTKSYKNVVVDEDWLKALKPRKSVRLAEGKILTQARLYAQKRSNSWGKELVWRRHEVELKDLGRTCVLVGEKDDRERLEELGKLFADAIFKKDYIKNSSTSYSSQVIKQELYNTKLLVATTAKSNLKYFNDLNNVWSVEKIMSKECKVFCRAMALLYIKENYEHIWKYDYNLWREIYTPLGEYIDEIINTDKLYPSKTDWWIKEIAYPLALEKDLLDHDLIDKAKFIDEYFKGLEICNFIDYRKSPPVTEVAKLVYNHNKAIKNIKKFKKMNPYFYVNFNEEEKKWLEANKEETKFINFKEEVA